MITVRRRPDVFDPNFAIWLQKDPADPSNAEYNWIHSPHSDYLVGLNVDDTDELLGFGAGSDFQTLFPSEIDNWEPVASSHIQGVIVLLSPTPSSGLRKWEPHHIPTRAFIQNWRSAVVCVALLRRYFGAKLSLGSSYTTFGSNGGWGQVLGCSTGAARIRGCLRILHLLSGAIPAMQADLTHSFSTMHSNTFRWSRAHWLAAPGVLTRSDHHRYMGCTSTQTLLQAAAHMPTLFLSPVFRPAVRLAPDDQQRIDFLGQYGGDKLDHLEGFRSARLVYVRLLRPYCSCSADILAVQRGQQFQTMISKPPERRRYTMGTFHVVGYKWWGTRQFKRTGQLGPLDRRDNPYDGVAGIMATGRCMGLWNGGEQTNYGSFQSCNRRQFGRLPSPAWLHSPEIISGIPDLRQT